MLVSAIDNRYIFFRQRKLSSIKHEVLLSFSLEVVLKELKEEVNIAYKRSVNSMEFKNVVKANPEAFAYVTLPPEVEPSVPASGNRTCFIIMMCITVYFILAMLLLCIGMSIGVVTNILAYT